MAEKSLLKASPEKSLLKASSTKVPEPILEPISEPVLLQKIWLFYKTSENHHKWDIYTT
jgi:hypothetical protein